VPRKFRGTRDGADRLAGGPSGHFLPMEQPGLTAAFIREMLTELPDTH
jgi:hypothetical protein